jgi:putative DNA methylase
MNESAKHLIEVALPLREVSEESVREKDIKRGQTSSLHIWWARRPLAASRATALAALLPDEPSKREEYLQLIKDISPWEVASGDTPQAHSILDKARGLILEAYGGKAPKVLDCFGGGGAIPLEAQRLGCEVCALDYNPVAVLLLKALLEYPQKYGQLQTVQETVTGGLGMVTSRSVNPLFEAVRSWGMVALEEARKEVGRYYPPDSDGNTPLAYFWARTVPCQHAECGAEIPLLTEAWLVKKERKKIALKLIPNKKRKSISLEIVEGENIDFDADEGTISRAHVRCPVCGNTIDDEGTRKIFREGKASERMLAVVSVNLGTRKKSYRLPQEEDSITFMRATEALTKLRGELRESWGIEPVPEEPIKRVPVSFGVINVWVYGLNKWGDLFNQRQKLLLLVLAEKIREVGRRIDATGGDTGFATAVKTYLALALDNMAEKNNSLNRWVVNAEAIAGCFAMQALPMRWGYAEGNPFVGSISWEKLLDFKIRALFSWVPKQTSPLASVVSGSACKLPWPDETFDAVFTDPPYYDNVPYSYVSDFFYVWLRRTLGDTFASLLATPLTPKAEEIVAYIPENGDVEQARIRFEDLFTQAMSEVARVLKPEGIAVIVFAYPKTQAWEAVIKAALKAGLYLTASWPIHTEMKARMRAKEAAALASSIYMVCRKRTSKELGEYPKVRLEIQKRVRQQLDAFWSEGIRGGDFFMSAIGPAVEVFGRYERVEKLSGEVVEVRELLDYVEKVVSEFALERILGSAELGGVDPETRFYLLWRWTYSQARVPFDEANKLAQAVGTELKTLWDKGGLVSKEKEFVHVMGPKDREKDKKFMNQVGFTTMVDAMHRACIYWEHGERRQLREHLAQTFGTNSVFWRVVQNIADVLPDGDKEKQLLQGLLNVPEARDKVASGTGRLFSE